MSYDSDYESDNEISALDYLKSLDLEDFLNCKKTHDIMVDEHFFKYEKILEPRLIDIYEKFNEQHQDISCLFGKDLDATMSHAFASMIYDHIAINYDVSIFYDCPELASCLIKK